MSTIRARPSTLSASSQVSCFGPTESQPLAAYLCYCRNSSVTLRERCTRCRNRRQVGGDRGGEAHWRQFAPPPSIRHRRISAPSEDKEAHVSALPRDIVGYLWSNSVIQLTLDTSVSTHESGNEGDDTHNTHGQRRSYPLYLDLSHRLRNTKAPRSGRLYTPDIRYTRRHSPLSRDRPPQRIPRCH
jgi:hypothetical protein